MKFLSVLKTWLLVLIMVAMTSGAASAKVASGGINLAADVHQGLESSKSLNALGIDEVSTMFALDSPLATNKVKEVDRDGDVVELVAEGKNGNISVITQMNKKGDDLILKGTHIDGGGRGSSSISELKELAKDLGRQHGAKNVIVEGGKRTTGANPGKTPRPIKIKVD